MGSRGCCDAGRRPDGSERETGWSARRVAAVLGGLFEGEAPVEDAGGVLGAGARAGERAAENDADQAPAATDRLEQQAVARDDRIPGLDADGAAIPADQLVGVPPPVGAVPRPLLHAEESLVHDRAERREPHHHLTQLQYLG